MSAGRTNAHDARRAAPWEGAASGVVRRLLGERVSDRVRFGELPPRAGAEAYRVHVVDGVAHVDATSASAALRGANDYLATQGISVGQRSTVVDPDVRFAAPAGGELAASTDLPHRFALNDTEDGYAGPYRDFAEWERLLDVLGWHGYNEVFVSVGLETAYVRTLQQFGYSEAEALAWVPLPGRQPWWLLQNLDGSTGGGTTADLVRARTELGARIVARIRELGLSPVLPGCVGSVPRDFDARNPGAHIVQQGLWNGIEQPAWLDPTTDLFRAYAATFYLELDATLGAADLYKMDLLHEGGVAGDIEVTDATRSIATALAEAHPDALWAILGWLDNPTPEMRAGLDPERTLVIDGVADRYPGLDREEAWPGLSYCYGSIWNFGGHTTIGAWVDVWDREFWPWRAKQGSGLRGIAYIPESTGTNPFAFDALSRLPWVGGPVPVGTQGERFADLRYGRADDRARAAWRTIAEVAHTRGLASFSASHEGLFTAAPGLDRTCASNWSPRGLSYDRVAFARALPDLFAASDAVRATASYAEDIVDVTRQVLSDCSRVWLPQLADAVARGDLAAFDAGATRWLEAMDRLDELMGTREDTLLGTWLLQARAALGGGVAAATAVEDIQGVLTYWGGDGDLLDYSNREWNGLVSSYYRPRWETFFADARRALVGGTPIVERDWVSFARQWSAVDHVGASDGPCGNPVAVAEATWAWLRGVDEELGALEG